MVGIDIFTCICECLFMFDRLLYCMYLFCLLKLFYEIFFCVEYLILFIENFGKLVKLF